MKYLILLTVLAVTIFTLSSCGRDGSTGPVGPQGQAGQNGATGPQGPAGSNGQSITVVQFCAGITPSYPSTFPEFGLCINNQLFGVYSTHGGFLALLPPGTYRSDTQGTNCDFVILPNCKIQ